MAKKRNAKKRAAKSRKAKYGCEVCGLAVSVDETCGCVDACDIVCCGQQMKKK